MVAVAVVLDSVGAISRLSLRGHVTGAPSGANLACAAVTLMVRSVARVITARPGWIVNGDAPEPGNLSLVIERRPEDTAKWLKGVTDTLLRALADIAEEYPSALSVNIEEKHNGS